MTRTRSVTMAVRSDGFAGVERYIASVATELDRRDWTVGVIGGAADEMRRALPERVSHVTAASTLDVARHLIACGRTSVVHVHMTAAELAAVLTLPVTRAPLVATHHFAKPRGSRSWMRPAMRIVERRLSREIAISRFVADAVGRQVAVLPNGVPTPSVRADSGARTILAMQRLEPEKGTLVLLRAFALSGLKEHDWKLVVAGRGSEAQALLQARDRLGLSSSVEFLGFVHDTASLLASSSVFVASAPAEPFGLSVVEAMAAGLAVIVADGGAHGETVAGAGIRVPAADAHAWAEALVRVAGDVDLRAGLAEAALSRHRQHFTLERHVNSLVEVYEAVAR